MASHQERPDLRFDQILCVIGAIGYLILAGWLVMGIRSDVDVTQPWRFIALVGSVGFAIFFGWIAFASTRVRYSLEAGTLRLQGAVGHVEIPLQQVISLNRWRQRWIWSGAPASELGVETVNLVPNTLLRMRAVWVLVYRTPSGERKAVGILPSPKLLAALKASAWEQKGWGTAKGV